MDNNNKVTVSLGTLLISLVLLWAAPADAYTLINPTPDSVKFMWHGEKYAKLNEEDDYLPDEKPQDATPPTDDPPTQNNEKTATETPVTNELTSYSNSKYTVKSGDTLWDIGRKLGISVTQLKQVNGLKSDTIYPGEVLYYAKAVNQSSTGATTQKTFTQADIDLLARVVYAESRGEQYTGQVAVAAVVINRVKSASFPNTVYGVVYQPWAFSSVQDGQINLTPNSAAYKAVYEAVNGNDPSHGALFFYNPATSSSSWIFSRQTTVKIGNHVFAK